MCLYVCYSSVLMNSHVFTLSFELQGIAPPMQLCWLCVFVKNVKYLIMFNHSFYLNKNPLSYSVDIPDSTTSRNNTFSAEGINALG